MRDGAEQAYFAGFFDGEGYVAIVLNGKGQHVLECSVTNTDRRPLDRMKELYGGKIITIPRRKPQHKQAWRWSCQSRTAERFLRQIYHHSIVKRERIELAIDFRNLFVGGNVLPRGNAKGESNRSKTVRILAARQMLHDMLARLNQRGIAHGTTV